MSVQLICYGACNPQRADVDRAAMGARRVIDGHLAPLSPLVIARLRTLQHTEHYQAGSEDTFRCAECGARRQWGAGKSWELDRDLLPEEEGECHA